MSTAETASPPMVRPVPQPTSGVFTSVKISSSMLAVTSTAPTASKPPGTDRPWSAFRIRNVPNSTSAASGRLMKNPPPAEFLGEQPAEEQPDHRGHPADPGPHAQRLVPVGVLEGGGQDGQRGRRHHRRPEALGEPGADQQPLTVGQPAGQRRDGEQRGSGHQQPPPPQQVPGA